MGQARHAFREHIGEVRIQLDAPTVPELFAEAARAFAELVSRQVPAARGPGERVVLTGRDREVLLVALFDELVFRAEVEGAIYPELEIVRLGPRELEANLRRAPDVEPVLHVKAATFHDLAIRETAEGATATIVLDV